MQATTHRGDAGRRRTPSARAAQGLPRRSSCAACSKDATRWIHQMMMRELADPTPALDLVVDEVMSPRIAYLSQVIAALLRRPPATNACACAWSACRRSAWPCCAAESPSGSGSSGSPTEPSTRSRSTSHDSRSAASARSRPSKRVARTATPGNDRVLSTRALNRALLARQLLLKRHRRSPQRLSSGSSDCRRNRRRTRTWRSGRVSSASPPEPSAG